MAENNLWGEDDIEFGAIIAQIDENVLAGENSDSGKETNLWGDCDISDEAFVAAGENAEWENTIRGSLTELEQYSDAPVPGGSLTEYYECIGSLLADLEDGSAENVAISNDMTFGIPENDDWMNGVFSTIVSDNSAVIQHGGGVSAILPVDNLPSGSNNYCQNTETGNVIDSGLTTPAMTVDMMTDSRNMAEGDSGRHVINSNPTPSSITPGNSSDTQHGGAGPSNGGGNVLHTDKLFSVLISDEAFVAAGENAEWENTIGGSLTELEQYLDAPVPGGSLTEYYECIGSLLADLEDGSAENVAISNDMTFGIPENDDWMNGVFSTIVSDNSAVIQHGGGVSAILPVDNLPSGSNNYCQNTETGNVIDSGLTTPAMTVDMMTDSRNMAEGDSGRHVINSNPTPSSITPGNSSDTQHGGAGPSNGGGNVLHTDKLFSVLSRSERQYKKMHTQGVYCKLHIRPPGPNVNPEAWLNDLLVDIISYFLNNSSIAIKPGDRVGMTLANSISGTEPVYISLRRADQLSVETVLDHIIKIFDSNKDFFLNGFLSVQFDHIQLPHGSGRAIRRKVGETSTEFIKKKACFLKYKTPENHLDQYCLPYALVVGQANVRYKLGEITYKEFQSYLNSFRKLRRGAVNLCLEAGVDMSAIYQGCSIDEVRKFQSALPDYQIVIYLGLDMKKRPYTDSRYQDNDRKINIMHNEEHYYAMRSITACFAVTYICPDCHVSSPAITRHACKYACSFCEKKPKCPPVSDEDMITCDVCNRDFLGEDCYVNHIMRKGSGKLSVCEVRKKCPICDVVHTDRDDHHCGVFFCRTCEEYQSYSHQCHMPLYKTKRSEEKNVLFVYYDFETQQDTPLSESEPEKLRHVPNLCVVQTNCDTCSRNSNIYEDCPDCGKREHIFNSKDCVLNLINFLCEKALECRIVNIDGKDRKKYKFDRVVAIAHNMSGFDGQFILKYVYESDRFASTKLIVNGTKTIFISLCQRINFIDSLNYFQVGLAKLPALFGFDDSKGYYCHKFNTPQNENYIGPLPAKHYYCPESMSVKGRAEFDKWYDEQPSDYVFDNKKELIRYCVQDVNILRKACLKFASDFWDCNSICPFVDACTIAGACNKVFRSKFLKKDTIGIIPARGYRFADNQSEIALKWMTLLEEELDIEIQHAGRGREVLIDGVGRVDGLYDKTVFEFNGCWYHGHDCLINQFNIEDKTEKVNEMRTRKERTMDKHKAIKEAGYGLVVMYECDFRRKLKANPDAKEKLDRHPLFTVSPLNPRDAFYGGRTNANTLYFKSDGVTKMHYYDICSLYPSCNKYAKTIISHPKIHIGDSCDTIPWQNLDGLMKVTVLPPRKLDFPVLPTRMHNKLMFVLCHTCGTNMSKGYCDHKPELRQLTGTWVIDEIKLAISKGYQIVKVHEIWEYQVTQYDPKTREGGLFSSYIDSFLKIKAEASGVPQSCTTPELLQEYLTEFFEREGIQLEPEKIKFNPALRQLAKIQLNSFWGRFGKREDLTRTVIIKCYDELVNKIFDHDIEIHSVIPINDDNLVVTYKTLTEARIPDNTTNVVIAAFTTAYARMELYKYLDMLGSDRVYYFDTDSIIFTQKPGEVMPLKGNFLGQMTDELEKYGPGSYIIEFVSGGPKNYSFKVFSPTKNEIYTVTKVKGITLNYENSLIINFDVMRDMVTRASDNTEENVTKVENNCIRRTNLGDVYTTRVPKTYRFNYTKRQRTEIEYKTVPYGY